MAVGQRRGGVHYLPRSHWFRLCPSQPGKRAQCVQLLSYIRLKEASSRSVTGGQWWTDYQPVSYNLTSKRGSRAQFASMVAKCNAAGVGVIVDGAFLSAIRAGLHTD
jgi:hypothetical protein